MIDVAGTRANRMLKADARVENHSCPRIQRIKRKWARARRIDERDLIVLAAILERHGECINVVCRVNSRCWLILNLRPLGRVAKVKCHVLLVGSELRIVVAVYREPLCRRDGNYARSVVIHREEGCLAGNGWKVLPVDIIKRVLK